jgi:hypothetical protein
MALPVEEDVATDPRDVGFFGPATPVAQAERGTGAIEQSRLGWFGSAGLVHSGQETRPTLAGQDRIGQN